MKVRLILILISNRFMLFIVDVLKIFKCYKLIDIILNQCSVNLEYCEENLRKVGK